MVRAASKIYNGFEMPANADVKLSKSKRPFYISGIDGNKVKVRYLDTGEYKDADYDIMKKYM